MHGAMERVLKRLAARHNYPDTDGAFRMEPLEVLQVSVIKRVFVVPLDLHCDRPNAVIAFDMVDLM